MIRLCLEKKPEGMEEKQEKTRIKWYAWGYKCPNSCSFITLVCLFLQHYSFLDHHFRHELKVNVTYRQIPNVRNELLRQLKLVKLKRRKENC